MPELTLKQLRHEAANDDEYHCDLCGAPATVIDTGSVFGPFADYCDDCHHREYPDEYEEEPSIGWEAWQARRFGGDF